MDVRLLLSIGVRLEDVLFVLFLRLWALMINTLRSWRPLNFDLNQSAVFSLPDLSLFKVVLAIDEDLVFIIDLGIIDNSSSVSYSRI